MKDFLLQTYAENKLTLPYVLKYYEKRVEEFLRLYGVNEDGHASERAAAAIVQLTQGEKSCLRLQ